MKDLTILAFSGSLRAQSFNTALLRAAAELAPPGVTVSEYDYRDLPFFNSDLDPEPTSVTRIKEAIASADGLLFVTPEFNHSVPGVLTNAIDWASRPGYRSVLRDKPSGMMSASMSFIGGARGQAHLKTILLGTATPVFPWPEVCVGSAAKAFTDGVLSDETGRRVVTEYMAGFAAWIRRS